MVTRNILEAKSYNYTQYMDMNLDAEDLFSLLTRYQASLQNDEEPDISAYLGNLSFWIQISAKDENIRAKLAQNESLVTQIRQVLVLAEAGGLTVSRLRVVRGIIILLRNLIPVIALHNKPATEKFEHMLWQMIVVNSQNLNDDNRQIKLRTVTACIQCLCNAKTAQTYNQTEVKSISEQEKLLTIGGIEAISNILPQHSKEEEELWIGLLTLLAKCTSSDEFTADWISTYYESFREFTTAFKALYHDFGWKDGETDSDDIPEASSFTLLGLHVFLNVITNARCYSLIGRLNQETKLDPLVELLRVTQILSEGKEEGWTEDRLISVCSWLMEYTKSLSKNIGKGSGKIEEILKQYERRLTSTLDSISSLMRFPFVVKLMNSYKFLDVVLDLFKLVCQRPKRGKFDEATTGFDRENKAGIKGIIIEIISYLVSGNYANQEEVRKQHCLELVLDSSNLDLEEPFIRERAILCIRALMDKNRGNQDFVANLEVKGAKMDEKSRKIMEECGYKVDIVDGKVKLTAMAGNLRGGNIEELEELSK